MSEPIVLEQEQITVSGGSTVTRTVVACTDYEWCDGHEWWSDEHDRYSAIDEAHSHHWIDSNLSVSIIAGEGPVFSFEVGPNTDAVNGADVANGFASIRADVIEHIDLIQRQATEFMAKYRGGLACPRER